MERLHFLDKFVRFFGILGLRDHETLISSNQLD